MKIASTNLNFIREPLKAPFGFKGGYLNELWQVACRVSTKDHTGVGVGVQSVLWSDSQIFSTTSQGGGNALMYLISEYALKYIEGTSFESPMEAMEGMFDKVYQYAKSLTNKSDLRKTFALNALVPVDNALWQLYGKEKETTDFLSLLPDQLKKTMSFSQEYLCNIPLVSYNMSIEEVKKLVDQGFFLLKIKIGSDPDKDGSQEKMVKWDQQRLLEIHEAVKNVKTPYTDSGLIPYYLDANGRYENKSRLKEFLDFADEIGALDRIMILEEPFPEEYLEDVSDLPVRIAADESAHSYQDAAERIDLGYKAIALKPIAKTMSMSIQVLNEAAKRNIPCFCADLTVNPLMVQWNKNMAGRIGLFPGMKIGVLESNGAQNYLNWETMKTYAPGFLDAQNGLFTLGKDFYQNSGGIFEPSYYETIV